MNYTTIYTDDFTDRNIIFMYEDNRLCGMNFHHGTSELDIDYMKNDQELLDIYMTHVKGAATNATIVDIAQNAIEEYLFKHNKYDRDIRYERISETMNEIMLERFAEQSYLTEVIVDGTHERRLKALQDLMNDLMHDIYESNTKKND